MDIMVHRRFITILLMMVMVSSTLALPSSLAKDPLDRNMGPRADTVLTTFAHGSTDNTVSFSGPGHDLSTEIRLPKAGIVRSATMNVTSLPYGGNATLLNSTWDDWNTSVELDHVDKDTLPGNVTLDHPFDDEFDDNALDQKWSWMNQPGTWDEGTTTADNIHIVAGSGTGWYGGSYDAPFLYQDITGNFVVTVKVSCLPGANFHQAGIVIRENDNNWAKLVYGHNANPTVWWISYENGNPVQDTDTLTASPMYLRLSRTGTSLNFQHSTDGSSWTSLNQDTNDLANQLRVGIMVAGAPGSSFQADFDWFRVNRFSPEGNLTSAITVTAHEVQSVRANWTTGLMPVGVGMNLSIRANSSAAWQTLKRNESTPLDVPGSELQFRLHLNTSNLGMSPRISQVSIEYSTQVRPTDVKVDVGDNGTLDLDLAGPLGSDVGISFNDKLNVMITEATADQDGNVTIPINVSSSTAGDLVIDDLHIVYGINAMPDKAIALLPTGNLWLLTTTPSFTMNCTDPDGNDLQYVIEISDDDFIHIQYVFDQRANDTGWGSTTFASGSEANFTVPDDLALENGGAFTWRVFAYDGREIGPYSNAKAFRIDSTPPTGAVIDDGEYNPTLDTLRARLWFEDQESGLVEFEYWVGNATGGKETVDVTSTDNENVSLTGLDLMDGETYYFTARARNRADQWSANISSDGITVKYQGPPYNVAPTISITTPGASSAVKDEVNITGVAADRNPEDILTVSIRFDDGQWRDAEGGKDWHYLWDTTKFKNGEVTISVKAFDGELDSNITSINVTIDNPIMLSIISYSPDGNPTIQENGSLEFSVTVDYKGDSALKYSWSRDGQNVQLGPKFVFNANYQSAGTYEIEIVVFDGVFKDSHSWVLTVLDLNRPPTAKIAYPTNGSKIKVTTAIEFDSAGSSDPDIDNELNFTWTFGDGEQAHGRLVTHKFAEAGTYLIELRVFDGKVNVTDTIEIIIEKQVKEEDLFDQLLSPLCMLLGVILLVAIIAVVAFVLSRRKKRMVAQMAERPRARRRRRAPPGVAEEVGDETGYEAETTEAPAEDLYGADYYAAPTTDVPEEVEAVEAAPAPGAEDIEQEPAQEPEEEVPEVEVEEETVSEEDVAKDEEEKSDLDDILSKLKEDKGGDTGTDEEGSSDLDDILDKLKD